MGKESDWKISSGAQQQRNPRLSKLVLTLWLQGIRRQSHGKLEWAKLQQNTRRHSWSWGSHQPNPSYNQSVSEPLCQEDGRELPFSHSALGSPALCYRFDQEGAYLLVRQPSRLYIHTCTAFNTERCQFESLCNVLFHPQAGCSITGSFLHIYPTPSSLLLLPLIPPPALKIFLVVASLWPITSLAFVKTATARAAIACCGGCL